MQNEAWLQAERVSPEVSATIATELLARSTDSLQIADLSNLPARLDDMTLAMVQEIANCPLPVLPPCDDRHFAMCFRTLATVLARRNHDDDGGELLVRVYRRMLGHFPAEAISFMTEEVITTCRWLPTVAECLDIIGRWRRNDDATKRRSLAEVLVRRELQARFDETMAKLASRELDQAAIDALPKRWKRIAAGHCYLWERADGTFTVRPSSSVAPPRTMSQADVDALSEDLVRIGLGTGALVRDELGHVRLATDP